jgi:hypothetical protein
MQYAPLADINRQIIQLAHRADKLARVLRHLKDEAGYFGRVRAHLGDFAAIARSTAPPTGNGKAVK